MKKKWKQKLIKHFFGIAGIYDEHVELEVGKATTWAVIAVFIFEMIFNFGMLLLASLGAIHNFETVFYLTLAIQIIGVSAIISLVTYFRFKKSGINNKEVIAEKKTATLDKFYRKSVSVGTGFFLFEWIFSTLFDMNGQGLWFTLFTWREIRMALLEAIIFTALITFFGRRKIKTIKYDNE